MDTKYVFITGGVVSGLGKGIIGASLGRLLKCRNFKVTMQKLDPYINVDAGTMNPLQHGEVFVTEDGGETDLDLGHYERFIDENLTVNSSVTTGKIYSEVIRKERSGEYLGKTVQVVPHVINEIKLRILKLSNMNVDFAIVEIGGTVGDIESQPFLEAIRQIYLEIGRENVMYVHNTLITKIPNSLEQKSKPTQHGVKELLSFGIQPDIIVCRSDDSVSADIKSKIAMFCNVSIENVIENLTSESIYEIPINLEKQGFADKVCKRLKTSIISPDLTEWTNTLEKIKNPKEEISIAIVGKYVCLHDAYLSVEEALVHACAFFNASVKINWIDSEKLECKETNVSEILKDSLGIIIPGGFGTRGIEGKVLAAKYAREEKIPIFGICLGMQIMVIEFARHVLGFKNANSLEFNKFTDCPIVSTMENQIYALDKGGTMRLGSYPSIISENSKAYFAYNKKIILERHRHRYEINSSYENVLKEKGMICSGKSSCEKFIEIIEISDHPWALGVQFHPEFKSRINSPHDLFKSFIESCLGSFRRKSEP